MMEKRTLLNASNTLSEVNSVLEAIFMAATSAMLFSLSATTRKRFWERSARSLIWPGKLNANDHRARH